MTVISATVAASAPANAATAHSIPSQNLFEHMAGNIQKLPHGASPADLGRTFVDSMKGFVERSGKFANGATEASKAPSQPSFTNGSVTPGKESATSVADTQISRVAESLSKSFDYAIEAQMVVRGSTQVSSAVTTLIKGQ